MLAFGIIGYLMKKFGYEGAPLILAFILGPLMETSLRLSLIISHGNFATFLTKPICVIALSIAAFLLITNFLSHVKNRRVSDGENSNTDAT
jgi:putative tricarboxylic transport membrane protein